MTTKDELREKLKHQLYLYMEKHGNTISQWKNNNYDFAQTLPEKEQEEIVPELVDQILNLLEDEKQEHYPTPAGSGTNSRCVCGKEFATTQEINGHIQWQLATLKKGDKDETQN